MPAPCPGDDPIRWLLRISHQLPPADVPIAIDHACRLVGATSATIYLVDYAQQLLVPFLARGDRPRRPVTVEGSAAGDAFRSMTFRSSTSKGPDGPGTTTWVPVIDGADRLGVLAVTAPRDGTPDADDLHDIATVTASLVVAKGLYSDAIGVTRGRDALDVAAELRWTFLPPLTYVGPTVQIAGVLEPAYEIAGDCFDYSVNADDVHLAIFDAMGHGLEASRMANLAVATYRQCRRQGRGFKETYRLIDSQLRDQFGDFRFVTGLMARLDMRDGRLEVFAAGHPPPLLLRTGDAVAVDCTFCQPMGLGGPAGESAQSQLEPGDTIVLSSDGITEARPPGGEQFGEQRLRDHLTSGAPAEPISEIARRTIRAVVDHQHGNLRDDATLLLARWAGPGHTW